MTVTFLKSRRFSVRLAGGLALSGALIVGMLHWSSGAAYAEACSSGDTTSYGGGDGSDDDPYKISTASHLILLSEESQNNEINDSFLQTADIDLAGCDFSPIGKWSQNRVREDLVKGFAITTRL